MLIGTRTRTILAKAALVAAACGFALAVVPPIAGTAEAQELIRRRGLLDMLFGGPPERQPPPAQAAPSRQRQSAPPPSTRRQSSRPSQGAARPAPPPEPEVEKLENARVVLVVGDFLASGLAEGLQAAYQESPGVVIVDRTNGSSGFVRDDYYDWNAEITGIVEEVDPAVVVVMIGSNDRQQLVIGGQRERPQTEPWTKEYERRVNAFATALKNEDVPFIWTGMPPFKSPSMSSDMLAFNDHYKKAAENAGGTFVDIWEGFVDESGAFVFTGPDINGQSVRLRGSDGINFTRPAKRKAAFYVEKPLNKLLGDAVAPDIEQFDIQNLPMPGLLTIEPEMIDRTGPISLAGPELDGNTELLGASHQPVSETEKRSPPLEAGSVPGRADSFSADPAPAGAETEDAAAGSTTSILP
ncbi:DUF459 domain-containing protein [Nitratireductor thuwali]|uniref:DUF459 domain-containing protein n=1 Tax=Nitratireductor thuwali TaxID=2267699 RepID=A0ABY5MHI9_9HYPH|nr:hypothetical protein NTH_01325 [Nitratireductor thuwali]